MSDSSQRRSKFYHGLDETPKKRYEQKLLQLKILDDPFSLKDEEFNLTKDILSWPDLSFADIFCYLVQYPSQFSTGSLKAYKSLEAYKYVVSGLVFDVKVKSITENNFLVTGRVRHGQSQFTKTPNNAWLGIETSGEIMNAHCTCMAGLGEACSHVGAIMFYLQLTSEHNKRTSKGLDACTSLPNAWLPPSAKEVSFAKLSEINFQDPKRKLPGNEFPQLNEIKPPLPKYPKHQVSRPSEEEKNMFFEKMANTGQDIVILRLVPPYNDKYISVKAKIKKLLFNKFYDKKYDNENNYRYHELIQESVAKFLSLEITQEDVDLIEKHTREQSKSNLWFEARSGIITASRFRQSCHSDVSQPSKSLILRICYPQKYKFTNATTTYGCENEKVALSYLEVYLKNEHNDVEIKESGLIRSCNFPFLGATPDGLLDCSCCEQNFVIEIKCPFKCREKIKVSPIDLAKSDEMFCMEYNESDNKYYLKRDHDYFYQIQLQMLLSKREACYFMVYGYKDCLVEVIHIDYDFLIEKINIATKFYVFAILPELIGRWYSKCHIPLPEIKNKENNVENICTCETENDSEVITCADKSCVVKQYHISCLGIEKVTKKKWLCPYCSRKPKNQQKTTKKKN